MSISGANVNIVSSNRYLRGVTYLTRLNIRTKNKPVKHIILLPHINQKFETMINTHPENKSGFRLCISK